MAPPKKEVRTGFFGSRRKLLWAFIFGFLGACTVVELGLVSQQLHKYGNFVSRYPTEEYKNALGLLLFACIFELLLVIFHWQLPALLVGFFTVAAAVFWGAGAGIIQRVSPFEFYTCGNPPEFFDSKWAPFASQCSRIVTIQGFAWVNWVLCIFVLFGIFLDNFTVTVHSKPFYPRQPRDVEKA